MIRPDGDGDPLLEGGNIILGGVSFQVAPDP